MGFSRRRGKDGRPRAQRRRSGHDRPAKVQAVQDGDPHINAGTFRTSVLQPAFRAAGAGGDHAWPGQVGRRP